MNAKRIAGRVTGACGHSTPVYVPCNDCVEKQLFGWEQAIREECARNLTDEMKQAKVDAANLKGQVEKAAKGNESLREIIASLQKSLRELKAKLDGARQDAEGLRAQLHATQAAAQGRVLLRDVPLVTE